MSAKNKALDFLNQHSQKIAAASSSGSFYPFWNMDVGTDLVVRLVWKEDLATPFAYKQEYSLTFWGVEGYPGENPAMPEDGYRVRLPSSKMFGWKNHPMTNQFFRLKKMSKAGKDTNVQFGAAGYLMQGFIISSSIEEEPPENPLRVFQFGQQLFDVYVQAEKFGEYDYSVLDPSHGVYFTIRKTIDDGRNSYKTSGFGRKEMPLSDTQNAAIEQYGYHDLSRMIPSEPDDVAQAVIIEMMNAAADGQDFDYPAWGKYFRPFGFDAPDDVNSVGAATQVDEVPTMVVNNNTTTDTNDQLAKLRAQIRERQKANVKS